MNPQKHIPVEEADIPREVLRKALEESTQKAIDETFALGLPIVIEKNGELVEVYPNGEEKVLSDR